MSESATDTPLKAYLAALLLPEVHSKKTLTFLLMQVRKY